MVMNVWERLWVTGEESSAASDVYEGEERVVTAGCRRTVACHDPVLNKAFELDVPRGVHHVLVRQDLHPTPQLSHEAPLTLVLLAHLPLIHISEPTRQAEISYAVFCLKKKKQQVAIPLILVVCYALAAR